MAVDINKRSFVSVDNDEGKCGIDNDGDDDGHDDNGDNIKNDDTYNYENKVLSESSSKV